MGERCECCEWSTGTNTQYGSSTVRQLGSTLSNITQTTTNILNATTANILNATTSASLWNTTAFANTTGYINSTITVTNTSFPFNTTLHNSTTDASTTTSVGSTLYINCTTATLGSSTPGSVSDDFLTHSTPRVGLIVALTLQLLALLPCIFGNLIVFIVIAKCKKLRTKSNLYIINLTIADFLVGALVIPIEFLKKVYQIRKHNNTLFTNDNMIREAIFCTIHRFLITFLLGYSLLALLMISVDRYIAIAYPFTYVEKVTSKAIKISIGCSWAFMLLLSCPTLVGFRDIEAPRYFLCGFPHWESLEPEGKVYLVILYSFMVFIFFCNIVCYTWVARVALKQHLKIIDRTERNVIYSKGDVKNTKIMVVMFGIFILFWLPYMLILTLHAAGTCSRNSCAIHREISLALGVVNSSLNCYIYAWRKRDIRSVISLMLYPKKRLKIAPAKPNTPVRRPERNKSLDSAYTFAARLSHRPTEMSFIAYRGSGISLDNLEMSCSVNMGCYNAEQRDILGPNSFTTCQCQHEQPGTPDRDGNESQNLETADNNLTSVRVDNLSVDPQIQLSQVESQ